ncbi:zinc finger protein 26-like [Nilaparvata lugens]|uniref:zinc finger protein 26-like n=1 Tax=Nilaparvata lugens TaxID=108931 RepID=UPI00193D8BE0|nr:zinc finger protein 26-like [Nilaparvata lugens]
MKNKKVTSHLEKTVPVVNDPLGEPKNVDYKPTQRVKGSIYTCHICSSTFNNEYEVQKHLKIHSNYINHIKRELRNCNGISTASSEFLHSQSGGITSNGTLNDFQYQCYLCPSIFNSQDLLYTHIKQHEIENSITNKNEIECLSSNISTKIICKLCKKGFFTTSRYDLHVIEDHDPEKEVSPRRRGRIFQCNDCNKIFKSKVDITRHVSIHLKRKSAHVCSVCGKEYVFPVALKNHMLKHDPNYKIECPMCLERFSKRKELKTHKCRSVPLITVFKCNPCSLEFSSLNFLRIHEDLDHGIGAPYTCDYCTRTFTSNEGLMAHVNENHFEVNGCPEMSMKIENTDDIKKKETNDLLFDEELATNLEILMCTLCGALCITNEEFQEHMAGHIII